jgi:hypothetical protein
MHERADKVQPIRRSQRNDNILKRSVLCHKPCRLYQSAPPYNTKPVKYSLGEIRPSCSGMRDSKIHSVCRTPDCNDVTQSEENDSQSVRPFGTLRTVTERTDQDDEEESNVELQEDLEDRFASTLAHKVEGIGFGILGSGTNKLKELCQNVQFRR